MKVLQVTTSARRRGAEVVAHQLGQALALRGHTVTTVALEQGPADLPFTQLPHPRFDPRSVMQLTRLARAHDVAVSHGGSTLLPVAAAAAAARRPFVYRNIGDPEYWGRVRAADLRLGLPLRRADHVIALYSGAAHHLVERYRLDPLRVTVASNAVDATLFPRRDEARREAARRRLRVPEGTAAIGYVGSLSPEKRPEWAVDLLSSSSDTALLIAGDGPLRGELEQRVGRSQWADRARFLGTIDDVAGFLAALDVLVLPSRTEGVPGALLEAALVGVPVVATDVGGVGEVLADLGAGIATESEPAAFAAAVDEVLRTPLEHVATRSAVVDRHDVARVADVWEKVLVGLSGR